MLSHFVKKNEVFCFISCKRPAGCNFPNTNIAYNVQQQQGRMWLTSLFAMLHNLINAACWFQPKIKHGSMIIKTLKQVVGWH